MTVSVNTFTLQLNKIPVKMMISSNHSESCVGITMVHPSMIKSRESQVTLATDVDDSSMFHNAMNDLETDDDFDHSSASSSTSRGLEEPEGRLHPQETVADESSSSCKPRVRFCTIQIREYPITLGDNPSVSSGVPVTIEWQHEREFVCDLSEYEESKQRRSKLELLLPERVRMDLVIGSGVSRSEIKEQRREVQICRSHRSRTIELVNLWKLEEALEITWRATLNATVWKSKKRLERKYIAQALVASR